VSTESRKIRLLMDLRNGGVTDTRVLAAIELTPREAFVEETFLDQAYANQALPINCGQTISQPLVVGLMSQALEINDRQKVLEVGTGSGYQAAILSKLARRVYTIERHRDLLAEADVAGLNQEVIRVRKNGKQFTSERLFPVRFVPLVQGVPEVRK
jgi:protein-L-isoaspartate(D-aspartate) O-methyltransferase